MEQMQEGHDKSREPAAWEKGEQRIEK